jgi:hypothetical protein
MSGFIRENFNYAKPSLDYKNRNCKTIKKNGVIKNSVNQILIFETLKILFVLNL